MNTRRVTALIGIACGSGLLAAIPDNRKVGKLQARIPLSFERNAGQVADKSVAWVGHANGYRLDLSATGAAITPPASDRSDMLRLRFLNARPAAAGKPLEPLPGKTNYLIGADPKRWIQNLETYGRVEYRNVYDGIDVAWYGNQGQIEYDFIVHPSADASLIRMGIDGARKLALTPIGDVDIVTPAGAMKLRVPRIYQDIDGRRRPVAGGYVLESAKVIGFKLAGYDKTRPLIVDPTLVYGSFFGTGFQPIAVTTDTAANVYLAGAALPGVPTVKALQPGNPSATNNCFIMKLDPTATTVLYATYVGGSTGWSQLHGIAVDSAGELIATGSTGAIDFPLVNPSWPTFDTANSQSAILFKLKAKGNAFVYSTYMSGVFGFAVALDASRNAYVAGDTYATGSPTPGAWQSTYGGGYNDAFAAKLSPAGALLYFTFLGGAGYDQGTAIAVDSRGNAYVAGYTDSVSFPNSPPGAHTTNAGGYDAFVAKVSPNGTAVPWLSFIGGTRDEATNALVRDSTNGILYVAGSTTSADLPTTAGVIQPAPNGPQQGFIASVNPNGQSLGFVTYLGGRKAEIINAMTEPTAGQLVVAGTSSSYDLASVNAIQPAFAGNGTSFFKSTNSGAVWTATDAGLPSSVLALTADPLSASTILALSGGPFDPFSVYRTTNGGTSWASEPLGPNKWWYGSPPQFARSPANPAVVYAYVPFSSGPPPNDFVYRSTDGGVTWTGLANPPVNDFLGGLALSATDAKTLVEVFGSGGVYKSIDGGASFSALPPLTWPCSSAWQGPVTGSPDGSIYIGTYAGICKSTDNGSSWSVLASGGAGSPPVAIKVSDSNPSVLYALNSFGSVYESADGGATWNSRTGPGGAVNTLAVALSNSQVVYAAGNGGVFVSTDGAATWSPASSLPFPVNAVAVNPSHPTVVYTGGTSVTDGFVAKINTDGTALLWSTFYSGSGGNDLIGATAAGSGDVWVTGTSYSADLPITSNAYSSIAIGIHGTPFLARISDTTAPCSYSLTPQSVVAYGAQTVGFTVTAPSACAWTATPSDGSWIAIPTGASGTASGIVSAILTANSTGATRAGSIDINGQSLSITQADSSCTYSLTSSGTVPASGGTVQITVTAPAGCPWSVILPSPLITLVSGGSGTGNGTVTLSLPPNRGVQSLSLLVQVGPQSITVSQANGCSYTLSPLTLNPQAGAGSFSVTANHAGCVWSPLSDASWLSVSGSGTGSGAFPYTAQANTATTARTAHITLDSHQFTITQGPGAATVSPTTVSFGVVAVGGTSAAKTVTLKNHETITLNFSSILTSAGFGIAGNTCGASIPGGATCTVSVTFSPTVRGAATGTLTFTDDAPNGPQVVTLKGTGN